MSRRKVQRTIAIDRNLDKWFQKSCAEEDLSCSQVLNRAVRNMKKSGVLW